MRTQERIDGTTPKGGAYLIAYYQDSQGEPTDKDLAVKAEVIEFDAADMELARTYLELDGPHAYAEEFRHCNDCSGSTGPTCKAQKKCIGKPKELAQLRTLYIRRDVVNANEIREWAKAQGFSKLLEAHDMHVTVCYSRQPVDWSQMGEHLGELRALGGARSVEHLGDKGAIVLKFENAELSRRWQELLDRGASWDYDGYHPHVTLTYPNPDGLNPADIVPFHGEIALGPEVFEELDLDWADSVKENSQGVWRTINGRRVFIREGEDVDSAIQRSLARDKWKDDTPEKFLEDWFSQHRDFDQDRIDAMIANHPEFAYEGEVYRYLELEPAILEQHRSKILKHVEDHQTDRYVSGSIHEAGADYFRMVGALDRSNFHLLISYPKVVGLNLQKMAEGSKDSRAKQIYEAAEVLFRAKGLKPSYELMEEPEKFSQTTLVENAQFDPKKRLDDLESRGMKELRSAIEASRDALIARVKANVANLPGLVKDLRRLPGINAIDSEVRAVLERAWEAGSIDARREVRASVRAYSYNPNQPRHPAGSPRGGEWMDVYHGTHSRAVKSIKEKGLQPQEKGLYESALYRADRANSIWVTTNLNSAKQYAWLAARARGGNSLPVVITLRIPSISWDANFKMDVESPEPASERYWPGGSIPADQVVSAIKRSGLTEWKKLFALDEPTGEQIVYCPLVFLGDEFDQEHFSTPSDIKDSEVLTAAMGRALVKQFGVKEFADSSFSPRAAARWLKATAFWVTGVLESRVLNDAKAAILSGLKTGKSTLAIAEELFAVFVPYLGDSDVIADEEQLQPYRLETIVRTNTTTAYNHGRLTTFIDKDIVRFLKGVRYSAIIDERTTDVCDFLHEKVFRPSDPDLEALLPPNHFNCRAIVVPVVAGEKIDESEFITAKQIAKARGLADVKFLSEGDKRFL